MEKQIASVCWYTYKSFSNYLLLAYITIIWFAKLRIGKPDSDIVLKSMEYSELMVMSNMNDKSMIDFTL